MIEHSDKSGIVNDFGFPKQVSWLSQAFPAREKKQVYLKEKRI